MMAHGRIVVEACLDYEFNPSNYDAAIQEDATNDEMFAYDVKTAKEDVDNIIAMILENPNSRTTLKFQYIGNEGEVKKEETIE